MISGIGESKMKLCRNCDHLQRSERLIYLDEEGNKYTLLRTETLRSCLTLNTVGVG